jgi:hypothetical protein
MSKKAKVNEESFSNTPKELRNLIYNINPFADFLKAITIFKKNNKYYCKLWSTKEELSYPFIINTYYLPLVEAKVISKYHFIFFQVFVISGSNESIKEKNGKVFLEVGFFEHIGLPKHDDFKLTEISKELYKELTQ